MTTTPPHGTRCSTCSNPADAFVGQFAHCSGCAPAARAQAARPTRPVRFDDEGYRCGCRDGCRRCER